MNKTTSSLSLSFFHPRSECANYPFSVPKDREYRTTEQNRSLHKTRGRKEMTTAPLCCAVAASKEMNSWRTALPAFDALSTKWSDPYPSTLNQTKPTELSQSVSQFALPAEQTARPVLFVDSAASRGSTTARCTPLFRCWHKFDAMYAFASGQVRSGQVCRGTARAA